MKASSISASTLRVILIISLAVLILSGTGGFLYLRALLVAKAEETAGVVANVDYSDKQLQSLKDAERKLNENASIEQKVREMVPAKESYAYQDAIVLNIIAIAKKAGVTIKNIDYTVATATGTDGNTSTVTLPGGITSTTANVTFESPLRYDNWLAFVHYIEQNTLRMQIANVSISSTGESADGHSLITSDGFTIGVYVRNG